MKTISPLELRHLLAKVNRPQPISLIALTPVDAKKTDNALPGRLMKLAKYRAWVGSSYEGMVNNRIAKEGNADILTFVAAPRSWGKHVSAALVHHVTKEGDERWYLSAQILAAPSPMYLVEHVKEHLRQRRLRLTGIAKEKIAHLLPASRPPKYQAIDKPVIHRDIDLRNIRTIAVGGETYRVEQNGA